MVKDLGIYFRNAIATATNTNISDQRESSSSGISWRLVQGNSKWFTTFQYVKWKMVVSIKWCSLVQKRWFKYMTKNHQIYGKCRGSPTMNLVQSPEKEKKWNRRKKTEATSLKKREMGMLSQTQWVGFYEIKTRLLSQGSKKVMKLIK